MNNHEIKNIIDKLIDKTKENQFLGYDPYDFSNSKLPIFNKPGTGIISKLSYINKISIFNIRPLLQIEKTKNSKANALYLNAFILYDYERLYHLTEELFEWFCENQPDDYKDYFSSGFSFKISLSGYVSGPGKTSLIISLFTMYAFVNLYNKTKDEKVLSKIVLFEKLINEKLPQYEDDEILYYSYHFDRFDETFNATAKIGKFFALLYNITGQEYLKIKIGRILTYLQRNQRSDGSWPYSKKLSYSDNFHTAFILESIFCMHKVMQNDKSIEMFDKGLNDYVDNFFHKNRPLHFHKKHHKTNGRSLIGTEIRDCANAIILFSSIGNSAKSEDILNWTVNNLYCHGKVYFYLNSIFKCKIDYIRWNAWFLYSLIIFLKSDR